MEIRYLECANRLLNRICVNKGGLDLSTDALWVSVGQRVAEIPAIKVEGLKTNSASEAGSNLAARKNFFYLQL